MTQRTLISFIDTKDGFIEALVQSVPRSFKYYVWAAPNNLGDPETIELKYLGTILPLDPTDNIEIEEMVRKLYEHGRNTTISRS